jgi:peroxiredoxin Q/BCP
MKSLIRSIVSTTTVACAAVVLAIAPSTAKAEPLAVGAPAPEVSAKDQNGAAVVLKDIYAKGPTLVYFYPKSDTPGCTKQACSFRDQWSAVEAKALQVVGVSADSVEAQKAFTEKYKLPFTIVADTDGKVAAAFGVGKFKRQSFLIKDGKVAWNMLDRTSTATHADDVIKALSQLAK